MASRPVKPTPFNPQIGDTLVNWDGRQATVLNTSRKRQFLEMEVQVTTGKKHIWFKHNVAKVIPGGAVSVNEEFLCDLNTEMSPTPTQSPSSPVISVPAPAIKSKKSIKRPAVEIETEYVDEFNREYQNKNTKKKTNSDVNILLEYIKQTEPRYKDAPLEQIPAGDLNDILSKFFIQTKRLDGCDYEPSTIEQKYASIAR